MRTLLATVLGILACGGFTFSRAQSPDPGVALPFTTVIPSTMSADTNVERDGVFNTTRGCE